MIFYKEGDDPAILEKLPAEVWWGPEGEYFEFVVIEVDNDSVKLLNTTTEEITTKELSELLPDTLVEIIKIMLP